MVLDGTRNQIVFSVSAFVIARFMALFVFLILFSVLFLFSSFGVFCFCFLCNLSKENFMFFNCKTLPFFKRYTL